MMIWRSAAFRQPSTTVHARAFSLYALYHYSIMACCRPHQTHDVNQVLAIQADSREAVDGVLVFSVGRSILRTNITMYFRDKRAPCRTSGPFKSDFDSPHTHLPVVRGV